MNTVTMGTIKTNRVRQPIYDLIMVLGSSSPLFWELRYGEQALSVF